MEYIKNIYFSIKQSHLFVVVFSLFAGIFFADIFVSLGAYSTFILGAIFFLSALKIRMREVVGYLKNRKMVVTVSVFMLVLFPVIIFYLTSALVPTLAVAFLLLAAMPAGMTTPLLAEISGGRQSLALVLTVVTSLLAPFTVPIVMKSLAGAVVPVSFSDMFISIATVIFIPFLLANLLKIFWRKKIREMTPKFKGISTLLLGLLIISITAKQSDVIINSFEHGDAIFYLAALFVLFIIFHIAGYFSVFSRDRKDRVTTTVCLTYMNFTLAIFLADKFFSDPTIVVPVVLSIIPWAILLTPFGYIMNYFARIK